MYRERSSTVATGTVDSGYLGIRDGMSNAVYGSNVRTSRATRHMIDVTTPRFSERRAQGEIISNDMTSTKTFEGNTPGLVTSTWVGGGDPYTGRWTRVEYEYPALHADASLRDLGYTRLDNDEKLSYVVEAQTAALANVKSPDSLSIVSVAELRKTLELLVNPVGALGKMFRGLDYRYGKRVKADRARTQKERLDALTSEWLRYRYGVQTTILEIQGILKALHRKTSARYTARATRARGHSDETSYHDVSLFPYLVVPYETVTARRLTARSSILYSADVTLLDALGFSLEAVPVSALELTRLSFVLGWVSNLGDFIQAATPKTGVVYLCSVTTVTEEILVNRQSLGATSTHAGFSAAHGASHKEHFHVVHRERTGFTPTEYGFVVRNNLTPQRLMDAFALTNQFARRLKNGARL